MTSSKITNDTGETDTIVQDAPAAQQSFTADTQASPAQDSPHARTREHELKALLERDARKAATNQTVDVRSAIERQQASAKKQKAHPGASAHPNATSSAQTAQRNVFLDNLRAEGTGVDSAQPVEFEYHTDRIMLVVVAILLVLSLIGWGAYALMTRADDRAQVYEPFAKGSADEGQMINTAQTTAIESTDEEPKLITRVPTPVTEQETRQNIEATQPKPIDRVEEPTTLASTAGQATTSTETVSSSGSVTSAGVTASPQAEVIPANAQQQSSTQSAATQSQSNAGDVIQEPNLISRAHLAKSVAQFEPVDIYESSTIALDGRASFRMSWFTHLTNLTGQQVVHLWYYEDQQVAEINIKVGGPSWRASSNKLILASNLGQWQVDAVTSEGKLLARQRFNLVQ